MEEEVVEEVVVVEGGVERESEVALPIGVLEGGEVEGEGGEEGAGASGLGANI